MAPEASVTSQRKIALEPRRLPALPVRVPTTLLCGHDEAPASDPHRHTSAPMAHITPMAGWGSDPHGPIFWKGRYHLFHQSRPGTCQWFWGMRWDHLVSLDLMTWARLPPALVPTPGGLDADGAFTGNIQVHPATGVPMLFYTGARLRHNPNLQHPEPPLEARNDHMLHWETQLCAVADPDDDLLVAWTKVAAPWMDLPHCAWLTAWRDPFFVPPELIPSTGLPRHEEQQDAQGAQGARGGVTYPAVTQPSAVDGAEPDHMMVIGSGLEGLGGTALIYRSKDLAAGWRFDGYLCSWPNLDTGVCWECPHLLNLPDLPPGLGCCSTVPARSGADADAQERLIREVDQAWERVGAKPAHMWKCVPVCPNATTLPDEVMNGPTTQLSPAPPEGEAGTKQRLMFDVLEAGLVNAQSVLRRATSGLFDSTRPGSALASLVGSAMPSRAPSRAPSRTGSSSVFPNNRNGETPEEELDASLQLSPSPSPGGAILAVPSSFSLGAAVAASLGADTEEEAERTLTDMLTDVLQSNISFRARTAQGLALTADTMSGEEATPVESLIPALETPGGSGAQETLVQAILTGRAEAAAALREESALSPSDIQDMAADQSVVTSASTLDQASLCDVKATHEAGLGGLGIVGVLSHCAPGDIPRQPIIPGLASEPPTPPFFAPGTATKAEIHAACRAYAIASAAAQGYDLGMPPTDSDVVRRCKVPPAAPTPAAPDQRWFLGLAPDAATYGVLYFIGTYTHNRFHLESAQGPYKLDLGNALYAPVAFYDQKHGRHLIWGYLKELTILPPPPSMCNKYAHSGCVSLPRALYLDKGRLHQVPLPEMSLLRVGEPWTATDMLLQPGAPLRVPEGAALQQADIELVVRRGSSTSILLHLDTWRDDNEGAAAIQYTWATRQLEVILKAPRERPTRLAPVLPAQAFEHSCCGTHSLVNEAPGVMYELFVDPKVPPVPDMNPDVPDWIRMKPLEAGGTLWCSDASDRLELRIFIDASALEIFTGTGQTLTTRVYRGSPQSDTAGPKLKLSCVGGEAEVDRLAVHRVRSTWLRGSVDAPLQAPVTNQLLQKWLKSFG